MSLSTVVATFVVLFCAISHAEPTALATRLESVAVNRAADLSFQDHAECTPTCPTGTTCSVGWRGQPACRPIPKPSPSHCPNPWSNPECGDDEREVIEQRPVVGRGECRYPIWGEESGCQHLSERSADKNAEEQCAESLETSKPFRIGNFTHEVGFRNGYLLDIASATYLCSAGQLSFDRLGTTDLEVY